MPPPMQSDEANRADYVSVEIYNQTYQLSGPNAAYLQQLAGRVDAVMRKVGAQARTLDSLRIAVLAAINLADELAQLEARSSVADTRLGEARIANLSGMLDKLLADEQTKANG